MVTVTSIIIAAVTMNIAMTRDILDWRDTSELRHLLASSSRWRWNIIPTLLSLEICQTPVANLFNNRWRILHVGRLELLRAL